MTDMTFSIARQFSPYPGPRYARQGEHSGEALGRILARKLREPIDRLVVELDGTRGYGSSFLDEAFGGLIRVHGFNLSDLRSRLVIRTTDPSYKLEVEDSLRQAAG